MELAGKIEVDVEVKAAPELYWNSIRDSTIIFPKAFPQQYKSIEVLEGDGKAVGSERLFTYAEAVPLVRVSKERIDEVDEEKRMVAYSVIGGDLLEVYKHFRARLVVEKKEEGSLVKWSCEYERAKEEVPPPDLLIEFALSNFRELDEYLLKPQA